MSAAVNLLGALAIPLIMVLVLAIVVVVWIATGPLIAIIVLAVLASAATTVLANLRRRERMSDH